MISFFLRIPQAPRSTLFPYTTLFRSRAVLERVAQDSLRQPLGVRRRIRVLRSEEHTSELQSLRHLVCRLLLEKKKDATESVDGSVPPPARAPARSSWKPARSWRAPEC